MYYLKDSQDKIIRVLNWSSDEIHFVQNKQTRRIETTSDISELSSDEYVWLETIQKKNFRGVHAIAAPRLGLRLVAAGDDFLLDSELPADDLGRFNQLLSKTSLGGSAIAAGLFLLSLFAVLPKTDSPEELKVVQVMNRDQIEKSIVAPRASVPPTTHKSKLKPILKKVMQAQHDHSKNKPHSSGLLEALGSLKTANSRGGLKLDQAQVSPGVGLGGPHGSGGVQTSVYAKGLFAAPLGSGGKAQGAGGYGTHGRGGGQAGYGKVSLVGSGDSFFQPVESETWASGGLDRNEIAAVIQRHLSEVRFCYEQGLQQKPGLAGRLSMKFMIAPSGSVATAQVQNSSLGHVPVENCIREHLKSWNFPQPQGGVTVKVTYPFILRRVSDT